MNDGRFDRVNSQRKADAQRRRAKEDLIREIDSCYDLENLKRLMIRLVNMV